MHSIKETRYKTTGLIEAEFEPGSHRRVLKNLLGIKSKRKMDQLEFQEIDRTLKKSITIYELDHQFTAYDICQIHKIWLGNIYPWAGQYRHVNIMKDNFPFAAANRIPRLMAQFEKDCLQKFTPCQYSNLEDVIKATAIIHTEFILIHPFREGNGRVGRLLSTLMALQAGLPLLTFEGIQGKKRKEYITAVQAGLSHNYQPMEKIFASIIRKTIKLYREP